MKTVPVKKSKVSPLTKNGSSSDLMSTKKATTSAISSSNVGTDLGANDTSLNVKVKTKKSETETNETKTKESATVTKKYDFEMKEPSTKERANDDKVQNLVMKEPPAKAKINTKLNVNHMNKLDAPTKQVEMHRMRIHRCLQSQLHSVREKEDLTDSNGDTQSEVYLSYQFLAKAQGVQSKRDYVVKYVLMSTTLC